MFQTVLRSILFLWCTGHTFAQAYADDALSQDSAYNGSDAYLSMYEYDTSYFAALQDPYDFSKSWSIESEVPCEGPHCDTPAPGTFGLDAASAVAASPTAIDPSYMDDTCIATADGMGYIITGTRDCGLELLGADAVLDLLPGGVDGSYQVTGCYEGKPMYTRTSAVGDRTLFYNPYMGDWEVCIGPEPNDDQLVMYGDLGCISPLDVPRWHLSASLSTAESKLQPEDEDLYFIHPYVTLACVGEPHVNKHPQHARGGSQEQRVPGQLPGPGESMAAGGQEYGYDTSYDTGYDDEASGSQEQRVPGQLP